MRISDWSPDVCSSDLPKQCRGNDMANRTDIDTFEKLNDVSRTIMADGLIGGKRFADIIIEIMQIAAAYGADEARRSAHFFATTKETDFEQLKDAIVLSAKRTQFQSGNLDETIRTKNGR